MISRELPPIRCSVPTWSTKSIRIPGSPTTGRVSSTSLLEHYPVFVGEWAFGDEHPATDSGYAHPLIDFCRDRGLGWPAWIWDHEWTPRMFQNRSQTELTEFGFTVRRALSETAANSTLAQRYAR